MTTTKITSKHLTTVPSEVRKRFGLGAGDELEWIPTAAEVIVKPKKRGKGGSLIEMIGLLETRDKTDITRDHNKILYG